MSNDATILTYEGTTPKIDPDAFVAPGARVIGNVEIGAESSIWYNVVIRGDVHHIRIGARTNVQDGSVIHISAGTHSTVIGDDVLIGHLAMVHGCTLHDRAFVGFGAIVMDGCVIESDGMLAAGAMLTPGKRIPAGQLWSGRPAKYMRDLTPEEIARNQKGVAGYVVEGRKHKAAVAKG
ncbi:gamma carbonic anhydrase family protein [Sphingomonas sp. SRS2]|uniref:gamma carbonic anhydrase family protein n=1 Tax=Sphingomonas sp. SRS2 TaxID=133190 RepID=UPI000618414B|nr:gamma carbonic anhydrase family protein [Sphingomonas sp. SRS2]KKC27130.1 carbonic anhydrase [Sphingomonas sp. SRS2]